MTQFKTVSWERPLSAQLGNNPEVVRLTVPEPAKPEYVALEDYPDVRDVSRLEGLVTTVDGQTFTIGSFLGHHATLPTMDTRQ